MPEFLQPMLALLAVLGTLGLSVGQMRLQAGARHLQQALQRAELQRAEALRLQIAAARLAELQRLSELGVSGGAQVVRAVHKGIAAIPFTVLENIPATRDTTRVVRKAHDLIADAVYGSIGAANRGVGAALRGGLRSASPAASAEAPDAVKAEAGSGPAIIGARPAPTSAKPDQG